MSCNTIPAYPGNLADIWKFGCWYIGTKKTQMIKQIFAMQSNEVCGESTLQYNLVSGKFGGKSRVYHIRSI